MTDTEKIKELTAVCRNLLYLLDWFTVSQTNTAVAVKAAMKIEEQLKVLESED